MVNEDDKPRTQVTKKRFTPVITPVFLCISDATFPCFSGECAIQLVREAKILVKYWRREYT